MARTALFKKLPPDSGTPFKLDVHLSGFRDVKIDSRAAAERQITDFLKYCEKDADQPAARMLIGAWGEGKTEAFYQSIEPWTLRRGHKAYLVTSRSIANAYPSYKGLDTSEARLFLASVFHVLNNEKNVSQIPTYSMAGLDQWITECLRALGCENRKLFLFIDEVEQLLHEPQDLRRLMLGIKHILDGSIRSLMPNGLFPGGVFIFLACTPEAYNRISTDPEMRQVFGGYGRRMDKINIESISYVEAVHFIYGLLKYSYDGRLPKPLPISSPGVLRALATVAKKNMGNMVSLTSRLLQSVGGTDRHLDVIEPLLLKDFAIGKTITIEGHDTKCFEDGLYEKILQKMDEIGEGTEPHKRLFTTMLFDQKAYSTSDVIKVLGTGTLKGLEAWWAEFLKDTLKELSYTPGLLAFYQVSGSLGRETVFNNLPKDEDDKSLFRFGDKLLSRRDIEDLLIDFIFNENNELEEYMLVPANPETVNHIFGPLSTDPSLNFAETERLFELFNDFKGEGNIFYRLPKDLIDQIFPPPSPPGLEFIRDPSERFNLWRRSTLEYSQRLKQDLPDALIVLAHRIEGNPWYFNNQEPNDIGSQIYSAHLTYEREFPQKRASLLTWILVRPRILVEDINLCEALLINSNDIPHLILFLSNDPVSPEVINHLSPRTQNRACFVNVHPTYAKQMIASYWHLKGGGAVWPDILARTRESLLAREIGLYSRLDEWLIKNRKEGFVVDNPVLSEGTYKGLVYALRLLLNTQGLGKNLTEIFEWNRNDLRRLIPYGTKSGLVPETDRLESLDGFRVIVSDLERNGFVEIDSANQVSIKLSSCESLILRDLVIGDIEKNDWNNHLVILATPETIVEDLYVEALIQRGIVKTIPKGKGKGKVKNVRTLINPERISEEAVRQVDGVNRRIEGYGQNFPDLPAIAHLVVAKERDIQIITLEDVQTIINNRLDAIRNPQNNLEMQANAFFLTRFIEGSVDPLLTVTVQAKETLQSISQKAHINYNEYVSQRVPTTLSGLQQLMNFTINIGSLRELEELRIIVEQADAITKNAKNETKEHIKEIIQSFDIEVLREYFWFSNIDSTVFLHNYFAYRAKQIDKEFSNKMAGLDNVLLSIKDQIETPNERRSRLYRRLTSFQINSSAKLSQIILNSLKLQLQPRPNQEHIGPSSIEINSLNDLDRILRDKYSDINRSIAAFEKAVEIWERINEEESRFLSSLSSSYEKLKSAKAKFNLPEYEGALKGLEDFLKEAERHHETLSSLIQDVEPTTLDQVRKKISSLNEHLDTIDNLIESDLWKHFVERRSIILRRISKRIAACEAIGDLPENIDTQYIELKHLFDSETRLSDFLDGSRTCNEEFSKLEEVRAHARAILDRHLSTDEKFLLTKLLDMYTEVGSEETAIELDKLKDIFASNTKTLSIVESLWQKGIISIKLSL